MIQSSKSLNIINNTLIETDTVTQRGETNYLNVLDMYYSSNVLVKGNTVRVESDGGSEDAGTSYCIQLTGPYQDVVIDGNDLYSHCEGPALGVYSQNYYGDTDILVQNNKIDVTGLPTTNSWGLVSGIELQDTMARVYNNEIKTKSITGESGEGLNLYGISYAQTLNENHNYDIRGNTIDTEGQYTIYLLKAQDTTVVENFLTSSTGEGDRTVYIDNAQGTTIVENNYGRKEFYVSPDGDNKNPGSEKEPLQSIHAALDLVPNGGIIYLLEGNHMLNDYVVIEKNVSIIGADSKTTKLDMQASSIIVQSNPLTKFELKNIEFINTPEKPILDVAAKVDELTIEDCVFNINSQRGHPSFMIIGDGMLNVFRNTFIESYNSEMPVIHVESTFNAKINNNIFYFPNAVLNAGAGSVDVNANYWGTNDFKSIDAKGCDLDNVVIAETSVSPSNEINQGSPATITVDFNNLLDVNTGDIVKQNNVIPDEITVRFKADGKLGNEEVTIENGKATTTYVNDVAGTDEVAIILPNQDLTEEITILKAPEMSVSADDTWLGKTTIAYVSVEGGSGTVEIKVNGKTIATPTLKDSIATQTIAASDIKAGENTVEAIYNGASKIETFYVYGLVTNETYSLYFNESNSGRLSEFVPEGATLDFQGKFLSSADQLYVMEINKPVNIITSTNDAYIDLNTTAGSLMGDNPGNRFTISYGGSGTNMTGIKFHNTQLWLYNTHNVTLDRVSNVIEDQRVGGGVGATSIRANSTNVTVKNGYFYTKNNGGSSSLVMAWADYCTFENNTVEVEGNVGNMIYLTTFNVDIPEGVVANQHNRIINNTVHRVDSENYAICWGIVIGGPNNLIENNTVILNKGTGITGQWSGVSDASGNIYKGNKLYNASLNALPSAEVYDNYVEGSSITVGEGGIAHDNTVKGGSLTVTGGEAYDNTVSGTLTANNAYVHDNNVPSVVLNGENAKITGNAKNVDIKSNVNASGLTVTGTLRFIGSNSIVSDATVKDVKFGFDRNNKASNDKLVNSTIAGTVTFTQSYSSQNSLIGNNISKAVIMQGTGDVVYQNNIITTTDYAVDASSTRASGCNISDNYLMSNNKKANDAVTYATGKSHIVENNGPDMSLEDISDILIANDNTVTVNILPTYRNTTVTVKVNDKLINETSACGIFNQAIKADDIKAGENTVEVTAYDKTLTKTFYAYEIIIDVQKEIKLGDDNEAVITISGATGDVIVKLNGNEIATPALQDGSVTQAISAADIIEGENTVEVIYGEFSNSTTFSAVKKVYDIILDMEYDDMWLNGPNSVTITIPEATGTVSVKVNGKEIATPELSEGSVTQTIAAADIINGVNTVEVTYDGFTNSTTFNAQDNVVTSDNFDIFFDEDGFMLDVPFDELIFKGEFDAPVDCLNIIDPISITGDNAVLNNMGICILTDGVNIDRLNLTADTSLGSLIRVEECSDVNLTNLNINYAPGDEEAVAVDITESSDVRLLNSTIFFESHVANDDVSAIAIQLDSAQNVLIDRNNVTTKLPCVYVNNYDEDYYMMGSDKVNPVRLKNCGGLVFTNNNINSTTNDFTASFPTIQSIQIIGCSNSILDHNNISMIDEMTPAGVDNYLYGINFGYNTNVTFSYNNFNMSTSGGKDAAGTNYAFQGVQSEVIIKGNNITSKSNGPNLGIYVASMFGEDSKLLIEDNFINITGYASPSGTWALVSGIEIQNGEAKIYNNTIYTYNVNEYDDASYMYGISYAQWMYGTRGFDIQNNTVYTEGKYTISVIDADHLYAGNNTLYAHDLAGDDSINTGKCSDVVLNANLPPKADINITVDKSWLGKDSDVLINISNANENGRITIKVNDKVLVTDAELTNGIYSYTISAADLKAGENNITVSYAGDRETTDNVVSELFDVIDNVVTQDNFYTYFDDSGNLLSDVPFDELIFKGEFEDLASYITIDRPLTITGEDAVLNDIGFIIAADDIVIDNLKLVADEDMGNLIDIAGENAVISNNNISYVVTEAANAINVNPYANGAQILNNNIYFESTVEDYASDEVTNAICVNSGVSAMDDEADPITGLVISGNNITAVIPAFLADLYEHEYYVMGLSAVNGVRINGAEDFEFTNNNLDVSTNYLDRTTPTYQALYVASSTGLIDGNNISMIDTFTPEGKDVYLYAMEVIYAEDLTISNNNFNISTTGGQANAGAAYAIQAVDSTIQMIKNNITTVSNGPNLAVYLPSNFGRPCDLTMTGNFINVTGLASNNSNLGLVSAIEVQTGDVVIKENVIYTQNIGGYDKDNYIYGISYAQTGRNSDFEITDNEIHTDGYYTISLKSATSATITDNYLMGSGELYGDNSVIIKSGSGYTVENNYPYDLNLTIESKNITVGEDAEITVTYNETASGNIQLIVNGNVYTVENSGYKAIVQGLPAGEHIAKVVFESNDKKFVSQEQTLVLNVSKQDFDMNLTIGSDVKVGDDVEIAVELPENATGEVIITVDGEAHKVPVDQGTAKYTMENITSGNHSVVVMYPGDKNYEFAYNATKFSADKLQSEVNVTVTAGKAGEKSIIKFNVTDGATGTVVIDVNGTKYTVDVADGELEVVLDEGSYSVVATYAGDDKYDANVSSPATLHVEGKLPDNITIVIDDKEYNITPVNGTTVDTGMPEELEKANKTIEDLTGKLDDAKANATKLAEDLADANAKVGNLTDELANAKDNATKLADELADAKANATKLAEDLADAKANATKLAEDLADAKANATKLAEDLADAKANATKLAEDLADANAKVGNLTDELADAKANATKLADELADAKANVTKLAEDLADANAKVGNLTDELADAKANVTKLAEDLADANAKVGNLTDELADTKANATKLADELADAKANVTKLAEDLADANKTIGDLNGKLDDANKTIEDLNGKLDDANKTIGDLNGKLDDANKTIGDLNGKLDDANRTIEDLNGKLDDANKTIGDLNGKLDDAKANVTKLAEDLADANAKVGNLTDELADAKANATKLADELADAKANVTKLAEDLADANAKVGNLTDELADANANVTKLADELEEAKSNVADLTGKLADAKANAAKLADELEEAKANIADLTGKLADANANVTKLAEDLVDANAKVDNLTGDLADANKTIDELNRLLQEALANKTKTVVVDGKEYPIVYVDGVATVTTDPVEPVKLIGTKIEADYSFTRQANDYVVGERGEFFYAVLKDINDKPLANMTCYVAVNGPIYTVTTDDQGRFGVRVNLAEANTYTYALSFLGNDKYSASFNSTKLIMTAKKTSITAKAKSYKVKAKKTFSVTLKTVKNPYDGKTYLKAGKKVKLTVNGKTYTAKTNSKGVAKFTLKLTKKGKYTAKIKFAGDKTYKASSKSVKITIK